MKVIVDKILRVDIYYSKILIVRCDNRMGYTCNVNVVGCPIFCDKHTKQFYSVTIFKDFEKLFKNIFNKNISFSKALNDSVKDKPAYFNTA